MMALAYSEKSEICFKRGEDNLELPAYIDDTMETMEYYELEEGDRYVGIATFRGDKFILVDHNYYGELCKMSIDIFEDIEEFIEQLTENELIKAVTNFKNKVVDKE